MKYNKIKELYGEQQNLLLMDNNVLASKRFPEIIQEIKEMGFYKGAVFIEPNQLEIAIRNLKNGINDKAYMRRSYNFIHDLLKRLRGKIAQNYYNVLEKNNLLKFETVTKENLLKAYTQIDKIYESHRNQKSKLKHVDFNQGVDCRYIKDEYMQLMSEIPIQPLRITFDNLEVEKEYRRAVGLAAKYGIKELSAYLFYNYQDSPDELYRRLEINMGYQLKAGQSVGWALPTINGRSLQTT